MKTYNQPTRLLLFLIYVGVIFYANYLLIHQWLPVATGKGLWFYTGIASLLLSNFLVTPYYIKPVDAVSYSVVGLIALYSVNNFSVWNDFQKTIFLIGIIFFLLVLIVSFLQIITKESSSEKTQKLSQTFRVLAENFGHHNVVFSLLIIISLLLFHKESIDEFITIAFIWIFIVLLKPDYFLYNVFNRLKEIWSTFTDIKIFGEVFAKQSPQILLIQPNLNNYANSGDLLLVKDPRTFISLAVATDYIGFGEHRYIRCLEYEIPESQNLSLKKIAKYIPDNKVALLKKEPNLCDSLPFLNNFNEFIGLVTVDSSIGKIYIEVLKDDDLEAGCLIKVRVKKEEVIYQLLDGFTKEEIIQQKTTYGFVRAQAKQIGIWEPTAERFIPAKWLPNLNSPVHLIKSNETNITEDTIGHFPLSNFNIKLKNINHLVTHNTAILGILGVGKSMLSIELVERMLVNNIKVICLDLTNQYSTELSDFYSATNESAELTELTTIGRNGKTVVRLNVEEGGSVTTFTNKVYDVIHSFLSEQNTSKIKIFNPAAFEVWKQDSKPYNNTASMKSLTPTEITQIISEKTLQVCQEMGMTDQARVCLIYEEAHSLVPEWNSVAVEGDKTATSGTARAILQGRKFGLGCLLITQRTANVTKTILNQCNTIFAMRTFDDTGKVFLSNYIGGDYSDLLPNMSERQAVFFGKASSCENPILIRLNDRDKFLEVFRAAHPITHNEETNEHNEQR
ncbi:MAG: DUF87 domain-containing protein [Ignavibacteriales bacterium]|nr:DUF87 domain-containing protein [Ignavibacteriales bacterium]